MNNYIAIGIDKTGKMWKGHFGISPVYKIYNSEGKFIEDRTNPHGVSNNGKHGHDHGDDQPIVIKELLYDCKTFIGKRMGEESKLKLAQKLGIETVLLKVDDPTEALNTFLKK
ncbi:MAG: hypothetical protein KKF62_01680 [Bacteroidetes bacterium]|nr:hypothetical protein [Bacteroidota bacterium]MBU1114364.1 hypothetical protein [Bacteroidota bacterium]MBU1797351.1 hypothetical protein [Bacteroidota bacterium]